MIVSLIALIGGTVTFENPGIRLELFLKEVSRQTGESFHCTAYLNNEVLAASFKDQSIDVLKSQLARVIHGTWEQKPDGWWLIQTADQKKEEQRWVWETRNKVLQNQIDGLRAIAPKTEWTIKDAEKYWIDQRASRTPTGEAPWTQAQRRALRLRSPESRLCAGIASKLTVEMFTESPLEYNTNRYSVRGLRGHIELPIDVTDLLDRYFNERQLSQAVSSTSSSPKKPVHIEVRYPSNEHGHIAFSWLDKDWRYISTALPSFFLNPKSFLAQGETFPLSKDSQDIFNLQVQLNASSAGESMFDENKNSPLLADAVRTMFEATKRDPLGIVQGRCWIDFSRSVKKPLLVNLKDDENTPHPQLYVPTVTQTEFVLGMKREDADGWVLGRPINPAYNRAWRIDRHLIEEYAQFIQARKNGSLFSLLQIARINGFSDFLTAGIPNPSFLPDDQHYGGYLSALLGHLSQSQLNDCLSGARIPVPSISAAGQSFLSILVQEDILSELSPLAKSGQGTFCPLYYLPNGTRGMSVGASLKVEPRFEFEIEPVKDYGTEIDLESFAELLKTAKRDSSIFEAKFTVQSRQLLVTTVYLGDKSQSEDILLPSEEGRLPTYTWKTLPDSIRQQVLEAMKKPVK